MEIYTVFTSSVFAHRKIGNNSKEFYKEFVKSRIISAGNTNYKPKILKNK